VDNEDTQRTRVKLDPEEPRLGPNDSFLRALVKIDAATDALGAGIRDRDQLAVEAAAGEAFTFLAAAIAVFRRLETAERDPQRIGIAWCGLRAHHRAVMDLFERAKAQLADPAVDLLLEQLRISLTLAIQGLGERAPLTRTRSRSLSGRGAARQRDNA
jgi:hypothetical protein